jgi:hypothetical protein
MEYARDNRRGKPHEDGIIVAAQKREISSEGARFAA